MVDILNELVKVVILPYTCMAHICVKHYNNDNEYSAQQTNVN